MPYFKDPDKINNLWDEFLDAFRLEIYPTFEKHKIPFHQAVMVYRMNSLGNEMEAFGEEVENLCKLLESDTPPEEEWKKSR